MPTEISTTVPAKPDMRARVGSLSKAAVLVATALALLAGEARAETQAFRVLVVPGLELADLEALQQRAAVGLLVPGAGPRVSEETALAGLERGNGPELPSGRASHRTGADLGRTSRRGARARPDHRPRPARGRRPAERPALPDRRDRPRLRGAAHLSVDADSGLVSVADVAPTALGREDGLSSTPTDDAVAELEALDARIDENGSVRPIASLLIGVVVLALAFVFPRAALLAFATGLART